MINKLIEDTTREVEIVKANREATLRSIHDLLAREANSSHLAFNLASRAQDLGRYEAQLEQTEKILRHLQGLAKEAK